MQIEFDRAEQVSRDAYSLYFMRPTNFNYQPGQYIELLLDFRKMDTRGEKRWFTLSSSPTEDHLTITTRLIQKHPSNFKDALFSLKQGDRIAIKGPSGDFILPSDDRHIIWIAGGIGVTPFRSQMKFLLDNDQAKSITLIHSNRTKADICFDDFFHHAAKKMNDFTLIQTLTDEHPVNWSGKLGYIDEDMIKSAGDLTQSDVYLSGPEPMVDEFKPRLLSFGVKEELLHQDWFPGYRERF